PPITSARRVIAPSSLVGEGYMLSERRCWLFASATPQRTSRQRPRQAVVTGLIVNVALRRIAVHERPAIHRIGLAAGLVFHGEQHLAAVKIDHVLEAILVFVTFLCDQAEVEEPPM